MKGFHTHEELCTVSTFYCLQDLLKTVQESVPVPTLTRLLELIRSWMSPRRSTKGAQHLDPTSVFFPLDFKSEHKAIQHYKKRRKTGFTLPQNQTPQPSFSSTLESRSGDVLPCTWHFWAAKILGVAKRITQST